jgi:hypothetical protein
MGNLQVRFLEGWAPAMAPGHSTNVGPVLTHLPKTTLYDFGRARTGLLAVEGSLYRSFRPARLLGDFTP